MPTTSSSGLRYPASSDTPNIPQDMQNLATDLDKKVIPPFSTTAARTTAIGSPTQGQPATVAGSLTVYDGSGWRSTRYGTVTATTDASGLVTFSHGGPGTPQAWGPILGAQATDQLNTILSVFYSASSSTTCTARFVRQDTFAYLGTTTVSFSWWARF